MEDLTSVSVKLCLVQLNSTGINLSNLIELIFVEKKLIYVCKLS